MSSNVVVAIDGPSGSGKSSTSRGGRRRSSGCATSTPARMYRAMTWWMLSNGVDVARPRRGRRAGRASPRIESGTDPAAPTITVDGTDVAGRDPRRRRSPPRSARSAPSPRCGRGCSSCSASDRSARAASSSRAATSAPWCWPDADVKIFLTADPGGPRRPPCGRGGRLRRGRHRGSRCSPATRIDSGRTTAPLAMPDDAHHIDTTPYTLDEVIAQVVALVAAKRSRSARERTHLRDRPRRASTASARPRPAPAARLPALRPGASARLWRVRSHGAEHLPADGPVILASNHSD